MSEPRSYPKRSAEGSIRHSKKKAVRGYPMTYTVGKAKRRP